MKWMVLIAGLILLLTQTVFGQDKIGAPTWKVGDKWAFTQGMKVEVLEANENGYLVNLQNQTILFDKSTLNKIFTLQGNKKETYRGNQKKLLNFPLMIGKGWKDKYAEVLKWEDTYTSKISGSTVGEETQIFEDYKVLGWEELDLRAGRFKAVKVEYKKWWSSPDTGMIEGKSWYWYCPEVRYLIRYQYDKSQMWSKFSNWELVSFESMK